MPLRLEAREENTGEQYTTPRPPPRDPFIRLINSVRCHNVPILNFLIIAILGSFLFKLTTKYTGLYMRSSLITIMVTNLVLYGISETMAQSILCWNRSLPRLDFRFNEPVQGGLSFNSNDIALTMEPEYRDDDESESEIDMVSIDEEEVDRFIDYLRQDNESIVETSMIEDDGFGTRTLQIPLQTQLTYFQFNRLAGFMCWGFIMSFVQCWWYKFLQIYSKDPKFIEVLRKVLTDQLCFSPISLFCFFTYGTIVLENGNWEQTRQKLSRIYLKTLIINYSVWFPVQFFNFLIVPRNFQVPFSSSISVLWNCFLSMRNSRS
ncbi:Vacuolar membrane protein [Spathaspora sp. JA1]|nr:Vacuolar membrane protein [Spathaspora sp. JA1]